MQRITLLRSCVCLTAYDTLICVLLTFHSLIRCIDSQIRRDQIFVCLFGTHLPRQNYWNRSEFECADISKFFAPSLRRTHLKKHTNSYGLAGTHLAPSLVHKSALRDLPSLPAAKFCVAQLMRQICSLYCLEQKTPSTAKTSPSHYSGCLKSKACSVESFYTFQNVQKVYLYSTMFRHSYGFVFLPVHLLQSESLEC